MGGDPASVGKGKAQEGSVVLGAESLAADAWGFPAEGAGGLLGESRNSAPGRLWAHWAGWWGRCGVRSCGRLSGCFAGTERV